MASPANTQIGRAQHLACHRKRRGADRDGDAGERLRQRDAQICSRRGRLAAEQADPAEHPERDPLHGEAVRAGDQRVRELMRKQRAKEDQRGEQPGKPVGHRRVTRNKLRQHDHRHALGDEQQHNEHRPVRAHRDPGDFPESDRLAHRIPPITG